MEKLDEIVQKAFPDVIGKMKYRMPTYEIGARIVAFNAQKRYFSFYAAPEIVATQSDRLKGRDVGKCCIRFKALDDNLIETLKAIMTAYPR